MIAFTDGSVRKKFGGYSVVIYNNEGKRVYKELTRVKTRNVETPEMRAIVRAYRFLIARKEFNSIIFTDRLSLIEKINNFKYDRTKHNNGYGRTEDIKNLKKLIEMYNKYKGRIDLKYIRREENMADEYSRKACRIRCQRIIDNNGVIEKC